METEYIIERTEYDERRHDGNECISDYFFHEIFKLITQVPAGNDEPLLSKNPIWLLTQAESFYRGV
jgi:hypothetical protein